MPVNLSFDFEHSAVRVVLESAMPFDGFNSWLMDCSDLKIFLLKHENIEMVRSISGQI
jgi:hypothetical protein